MNKRIFISIYNKISRILRPNSEYNKDESLDIYDTSFVYSIDPDDFFFHDWTPDKVKKIAKQEYDLNRFDEKGNTLLFYTQDLEIIKSLLSSSININHRRNDGLNALGPSSIDKAILLLQNGIDISIYKDGLYYSLYPSLFCERKIELIQAELAEIERKNLSSVIAQETVPMPNRRKLRL